MTFRTRLGTALAVTALVGLAACGSDDTASDGTSAVSTDTAADQTVEPITITLLAYDSFTPSEGIFDSFTEETGISVDVVTGGDAGELVAKAALTAGNPEGDVMWGVDNTLMSRAIDAGVFEAYTSPNLAAMSSEIRALVESEGVLTPVDTGDVCINYDKEWFTSRDVEPPATLDDLVLPEYKDLLVVQNPNSSSPGLAFMMATIAAFGEDGWQTYWSSLRDNGVKIVDGWTEAYTVEFSGSSGKGDRPLVVSYASSPPAEVVYADPPIDTPPTGVLTETCFRQVEFAGVLAGTDNAPAAQKLVDFLSGPVFQSDLPLTLFVNPVHPDAEIPEVFTSFAAVPDKPFSLEPADIEQNRTRWIEEWSTAAL
jgi:thiamine transport system substrate-binding protein